MTPYETLLQEGYVHNLMLANNRREMEARVRAVVHEAERRVQQSVITASEALSDADVNRIRRGVFRGTERLDRLADRISALTGEVSDALRAELLQSARDLAMYEAMFWQDRYAALIEEDGTFDGVVETGSALSRKATTAAANAPLVFGTIAAGVATYRNNRTARLRNRITAAAQSQGRAGVQALLTVTNAARRVGRLIGETTRSLNTFSGDVHTHAVAVGAQAFADDNPSFDLVWTSIIDERTSSICLTRNGQRVNRDLGGLVPPAHFGCRSIVVPAILAEGLSDRDANRLRPDTRRAIERGLPNFNSTEDSFAALGEARQRQLLGATRFRIFQEGNLNVRDFIGSDESFIGLDDLAQREGIDLSDFRGAA